MSKVKAISLQMDVECHAQLSRNESIQTKLHGLQAFMTGLLIWESISQLLSLQPLIIKLVSLVLLLESNVHRILVCKLKRVLCVRPSCIQIISPKG